MLYRKEKGNVKKKMGINPPKNDVIHKLKIMESNHR
jgi:hypothetical protein